MIGPSDVLKCEKVGIRAMAGISVNPQELIALVALAFGILTVIMGIAACAHVLGFVALRAPYATWVVTTFFFSIVAAFGAAIKVFLSPAVAPSVLQCGAKDSPAILDQRSFNVAWSVPECQETIDRWLMSVGRYSVSNGNVINALASAVPLRLADETQLDWLTRIREKVEDHPTLGPLRKRAQDRDAPFQSTTTPMRIARGTNEPEPGVVFVQSKSLDGQVLLVSSDAYPKCVLRLRAQDAIKTAKSEIPVFHLSAAQRRFLLGTTAIRDGSGSKPGRYAIAGGAQPAEDPSEEKECASL